MVEDDAIWRLHYKHYIQAGFHNAALLAKKPWLGFNLREEVMPEKGLKYYLPYLSLLNVIHQFCVGQS